MISSKCLLTVLLNIEIVAVNFTFLYVCIILESNKQQF